MMASNVPAAGLVLPFCATSSAHGIYFVNKNGGWCVMPGHLKEKLQKCKRKEGERVLIKVHAPTTLKMYPH